MKHGSCGCPTFYFAVPKGQGELDYILGRAGAIRPVRLRCRRDRREAHRSGHHVFAQQVHSPRCATTTSVVNGKE